MGNKSSTHAKSPKTGYEHNSKPGRPCKPIDIYVAHYTPSSFPLIPVVTGSTMRMCRESWSKILAPVEKDGVSVSGVTLFYTEFFETLGVFDKMGKFEEVFQNHSALHSLSAKGAILMRMINFTLAIDPDSPATFEKLRDIGVTHNQKRIRPWQYAVFVQTAMNTIASRLGPSASYEVMTAWTHLFSFVLQCILPEAIKGLVNVDEVDINQAKKDLQNAKVGV